MPIQPRVRLIMDIYYIPYATHWAEAELNRRHTDFQSVALPTELPAPVSGLGPVGKPRRTEELG